MTNANASQSMTTQQLEEAVKMLQAQLKEAKKADRPKTAVQATLHTAKESGKKSICLGQGFRKAYLNADQVMFIINNKENMINMLDGLK